jgi:hypothetical protein
LTVNAIELDIIEKFNQLDPEARQRVRQAIQSETIITQGGDPDFDFDTWLAEVQTLRADIQAHLGDGKTVGSQSLLDEVREEASWARL